MAKKEKAMIVIPSIDRKQIILGIHGDSTLVVHAWNQKTKLQMLEKHMGKAQKGRAPKVPEVDVIESLYWVSKKPELKRDKDGRLAAGEDKKFQKSLTEGKFAIPAIAFKKAAVSACRLLEGINMTTVRQMIHVHGDCILDDDREGVTISGRAKPREDIVRVANGNPDIRFRGYFPAHWTCNIVVEYVGITAEQVINLFNHAGYGCGILEDRPEKSGGSWGMFHVEGTKKAA